MMSRIADQWSALWPALAFLLAGVPLASLLDRIGFFSAAATLLIGKGDHDRSALGLWVLAAFTTAVLNLDTTVVLLTPLCLRLAKQSGTDPVPLAAIPLLLASFASSILPISNLTTLIAAQRFGLSVLDVLGHLALPSLAACTVGWFVYRRRYPSMLSADATDPLDRRALSTGGLVVAGLLVGFVLGPTVGIDAWAVALAADIVLIAMVHWVPWRDVPLTTALLVAAIAAVVALAVPVDALRTPLLDADPAAVGLLAISAGAIANMVNNLPALLVGTDAVSQMTWGMWAWLLGVNVAAVLLPIGALANLLWLRIMRAEGLQVGLRQYLRITVPIGVPAALVAIVVLVGQRAVAS